MRKEHLKILKKLMNYYHTLPLDEKELETLCKKIGVNPSLAHTILKDAVKKEYFPSTIFMGRTLVYLTKKEIKEKIS
jgi:hypothetical protein